MHRYMQPYRYRMFVRINNVWCISTCTPACPLARVCLTVDPSYQRRTLIQSGILTHVLSRSVGQSVRRSAMHLFTPSLSLAIHRRCFGYSTGLHLPADDTLESCERFVVDGQGLTPHLPSTYPHNSICLHTESCTHADRHAHVHVQHSHDTTPLHCTT